MCLATDNIDQTVRASVGCEHLMTSAESPRASMSTIWCHCGAASGRGPGPADRPGWADRQAGAPGQARREQRRQGAVVSSPHSCALLERDIVVSTQPESSDRPGGGSPVKARNLAAGLAVAILVTVVVWAVGGGSFTSLPFADPQGDGCGPAPTSNGPHTGQAVATIVSPKSAQTGERLTAPVRVTNSSPGQLVMSSSAPVHLLLLKDDRVVSRPSGPEAGVGWAVDLAPGQSGQQDGWVDITDCSDSAADLPLGEYLLVAVIDDLPSDGGICQPE